MRAKSVRRLKSIYDTPEEAWADIARRNPELDAPDAKRKERHLDDHWCWRVRYDY